MLRALLAWAHFGPERPLPQAALRQLTGAFIGELAPADFEAGLRWAAGASQFPGLAGDPEVAPTAALRERATQVLADGGNQPGMVPRAWDALLELLAADEAPPVAVTARALGLAGVAERGFRKGTEAHAVDVALGSAVGLSEVLRERASYDEALGACDAALARISDENGDLSGFRATLLRERAVVLSASGALREAAAALAEVAERYGDDPVARVVAVQARLDESIALLHLGDATAALRATELFMARFDREGPCPWWPTIGEVLLNRAVALELLGRVEAAIAACEEVERRFGDVPDPVMESLVARAALARGAALAKAGRIEEAMAAYERAAAFRDADGPAGAAARQADREARILMVEGNLAKLQACDAVLAEVRDRPGASDRLTWAAVLVNRGVALAALDRPQEAIAAYDELIQGAAGDGNPELQLQVAMARLNRGNALRQMDDLEAAVDAYREVARTYADAPDGRIRMRAAAATLNIGGIRESRGEREQALAEFAALERYAHDDAPQVRDIALKGLWNTVLISSDLGRDDAVAKLVGQLIERYAGDPAEDLRRSAVAYITVGALKLDDRGHPDEAERLLREALSRFMADPDGEVQTLLANVRGVLANWSSASVDPFAGRVAAGAGLAGEDSWRLGAFDINQLTGNLAGLRREEEAAWTDIEALAERYPDGIPEAAQAEHRMRHALYYRVRQHEKTHYYHTVSTSLGLARAFAENDLNRWILESLREVPAGQPVWLPLVSWASGDAPGCPERAAEIVRMAAYADVVHALLDGDARAAANNRAALARFFPGADEPVVEDRAFRLGARYLAEGVAKASEWIYVLRQQPALAREAELDIAGSTEVYRRALDFLRRAIPKVPLDGQLLALGLAADLALHPMFPPDLWPDVYRAQAGTAGALAPGPRFVQVAGLLAELPGDVFAEKASLSRALVDQVQEKLGWPHPDAVSRSLLSNLDQVISASDPHLLELLEGTLHPLRRLRAVIATRLEDTFAYVAPINARLITESHTVFPGFVGSAVSPLAGAESVLGPDQWFGRQAVRQILYERFPRCPVHDDQTYAEAFVQADRCPELAAGRCTAAAGNAGLRQRFLRCGMLERVMRGHLGDDWPARLRFIADANDPGMVSPAPERPAL